MRNIKLGLYTHKSKVIADYYDNAEYAIEALRIHNDRLVKKHGNLGYNFCFLAYRKKKEVEVLVESTHIKFPVNEPRFRERVEEFITATF